MNQEIDYQNSIKFTNDFGPFHVISGASFVGSVAVTFSWNKSNHYEMKLFCVQLKSPFYLTIKILLIISKVSSSHKSII